MNPSIESSSTLMDRMRYHSVSLNIYCSVICALCFSALPKHEQKNMSYPCSRKPHGCKCLLQSQMTPQDEAVCRILPKQIFPIYMYIVFSFKHNICLCRPDMRLHSYSSAFFSYSSTFEPSPDNRYVHF